MRHICIAAILASTLSGSAVAQSLRPSNSPDGTSQSARRVPPKQSAVRAPKPVARQFSAAPRSEPAASLQTQRYGVQGYGAVATQAAPASPSPGIHDFFATIFAGPIMLSRAFRPADSPYYGGQGGNASPAYAPQAYAAPNQTDAANYAADPKFLRQLVPYSGGEAPDTVIVDTTNKFLYLVEDGGKALRYGIGVGRPGFLWSGVKSVTAKREWPDWRPPAEMIARRPDLPRFMPGGVDNPLGARALYLGSSLYRIHGSNEPWTIGTNVSSGCIRMRNDDVTDLYERVKVGTRVVVI
ncbi:MAG: L,D-transpeptidase [Xanthobacteraceae bacterium]